MITGSNQCKSLAAATTNFAAPAPAISVLPRLYEPPQSSRTTVEIIVEKEQCDSETATSAQASNADEDGQGNAEKPLKRRLRPRKRVNY